MSSHRKTPRYNQQFFRDWGAPGPLFFGIVILILVVVGMFLAFTKSIPFTSPGYEVNATFSNAVNIALKSPVRIAGINVGKVTSVEGKGDNTVVTFSVDEEGRPLHADASAQIRPRLFLEGNWFVDLDPGTAGAGELEDGGSIPITRTAASVQIGDVLSTLQMPQRANLQRLLAGLGTGLNKKPTAAEDATFEPFMHGLSGGESLNLVYREGAKAARGTAIVSEAFLGEKPNDLGNLLRGLSRVSGKINEREGDIQGFVTNFATFTGALAAESNNLSATVRELGPTLKIARTSLANLNNTLPALRGFAIAIEPGINEVPRTIRIVRPWTTQVKALLTQRELGGLTDALLESTPASAKSVASTLKLMPQLQNTGLCISQNLVPTGEQVIEDGALGNGQTAHREFLYSAVNMAGESQNFDGNGPFLRAQTGGGPLAVKADDPVATLPTDKVLYGRTEAPPLGTTPAAGTIPPFNDSEPCHTQDVPDLNGPAVGPGPPSPTVYTP